MKKPGSSRKISSPQSESSARGLSFVDGILVAMLLTVALFMMTRSGFRRGMELMPWPDGLEYAAAAINLDRGLGPVLHFGGYSYPSRYTEGYPLILAAAYPILGHRVDLLCLATTVMGLVALASLYILAFKMFGRSSAMAAGTLLVLSPIFITYSTLVLSDVPTMMMTIVAALAFYQVSVAEETQPRSRSRIIAPALFGLLAGFTVMIRPTNAVMLIGIAAAMWMVPFQSSRKELLRVALAFLVGFAIFPLWQAVTNLRYLGGLTSSGYVFWVPEVYGSFAKTFNPRFLFGPTMPGNPYGNVLSYLLTLTGLDGMLGDPGDPRYLMYPFTAAVFALIGVVTGLKSSQSRPARRVMWFGLIFLATLALLYLFYFFTEIAFILPAAFILFAAFGYGIVSANGKALVAARRRAPSISDVAKVAGIVLLDLVLAVSIFAETGSRISAIPQQSKMVPTLLEIRAELPPDAVIISNISLQFLELYLAISKTQLVGLNTVDPGGDFTDYHLARLYAKKATGWTGRVPPVMFAGSQLDDGSMKTLAAAIRSGRPAYLLVDAPESQDYAALLKDQVTQLSSSFKLESIARSDQVELFRLTLP